MRYEIDARLKLLYAQKRKEFVTPYQEEDVDRRFLSLLILAHELGFDDGCSSSQEIGQDRLKLIYAPVDMG